MINLLKSKDLLDHRRPHAEFEATESSCSSSSSSSFWDVVIVGAGPAALACLSALQEPYSLDNLDDTRVQRAIRHYKNIGGNRNRNQQNQNQNLLRRKNQRVLVIDPAPTWLDHWRHNFAALDITFLRSPALAHPDLFDSNALLAFAEQSGRAQQELIESGCFDLHQLLPLGQSQIGLWKLPSLALFLDFCASMLQRLPHTYQQGCVVDIERVEGDSNLDFESDLDSHPHAVTSEFDKTKTTSKSSFRVHLSNQRPVDCRAVVLAMGAVGQPIVPPLLRDVAQPRLIQWNTLNDDHHVRSAMRCWNHVLVVGGGLTSVQAALKIVQRLVRVHGGSSDNSCSSNTPHSAVVTLCSRRPLTERHFDLSVEWFDRRSMHKCMSDFYHQSDVERLRMLTQSRNGGSVPAIYMKEIRKWELDGRLKRKVGQAEYVKHFNQKEESKEDSRLAVRINGVVDHYDAIVLACGVQPDCGSNPLCRRLLERWPIPLVSGLPRLSVDAEWTQGLFCVGGMAGMSVGPDAGNLMGMRRAAEFVAHALDCRQWLRQENILKNPFDAFLHSDSDSNSDSDSDNDTL